MIVAPPFVPVIMWYCARKNAKRWASLSHGSWPWLLLQLPSYRSLWHWGSNFPVIPFWSSKKANMRLEGSLLDWISHSNRKFDRVWTMLFVCEPNSRKLFNGNLAVALVPPLIIFFACLNAFLPNYSRAFSRWKRTLASLLFERIWPYPWSPILFSQAGGAGAVVWLLILQLFIFVINTHPILQAIGVICPKPCT